MKEKISALLVYDQAEPLSALKIALEERAMRTCRAQTCREALHWFRSKNLRHIIFTDTTLPDGTWADVLDLAANTPEPASVIVMATEIHLDLYAEVIQRGAFDFIAPPFVASDLVHLVRCAMGNALSRRNAQLKAA